jgi:hypothetical protein
MGLDLQTGRRGRSRRAGSRISGGIDHADVGGEIQGSGGERPRKPEADDVDTGFGGDPEPEGRAEGPRRRRT